MTTSATNEIADLLPAPPASGNVKGLSQQGLQLSYDAGVPCACRLVRRLARAGAAPAQIPVHLLGGLDYIAWILERHSGQLVEIPERARRLPLIFIWGLFRQLCRRGISC